MSEGWYEGAWFAPWMGSVQGYVDMCDASFREERLTLAERGKMDVSKINDDDDDDDDDVRAFF